MLKLGIDDAGRGPIIGPMILAGVLVNDEQEEFLKEQGAKDSKLLLHPARIKLAETIKNNSLSYSIVQASPEYIDSSLLAGINLNTLEAIKIAEVINEINTEKLQKEKMKVVVDCPSVNIRAWRETLLKYIKHQENLDVICEHKADANHPSVSAASILAKVTREEEVEKIKKQYESYGNPGSGYPSDPFTKEFLKEHGKKLKDSGLFRKTWATWKTLFPTKDQKTLGDF